MVKLLIKSLNRTHFWMLLACVLLIVGQVYLDLQLPDYMWSITEAVRTPGSTVSGILKPGGMMLLCALGSVALALSVGFIVARVSAGFSKSSRLLIFNKVEAFSAEEINRFSTASLITRTTNDVMQVRIFIAMGLQALIKAPILAIWAISKILNKSWELSLLTAGAATVIIFMIILLAAFVIPRFTKMQILTDNLNRVTRENLTGLRVVRAYNAEAFEGEKFETANEELKNNYLFTTRFMAFMQPVISLVMASMNISIYWIGGTLVNNAAGLQDKWTVMSDMMTFSMYAMLVIQAFMIISMTFIMLPRAAVSAKRINEVLDTRISVNFNESMSAPTGTGEVEFKNVSFKYPDAEEYILKDISLKVNKGETVAFIGSTGSGKSTLVNLIPRFYDATDGAVLIDGIDVRDYTKAGLYSKLGYVPQRGVLFSGTVKDNVDFGDGASECGEENIINALRTAQAWNFVEKMEGGINAPISQGGTNVSGGQKQRLSIARAVARKPEIFIFDDTFSALDYKTDTLLRAALKKEAAGATVFIVAQRIGTILQADKIAVLEHGRLAGIGTHDQLLRSCKVYQEIARSQLSKDELENRA